MRDTFGMTTSSGGALAAFSDDLAVAVAAAAASTVYVDANPRRDLSGFALDRHTVVTVEHMLEAEEDIDLLLPGGGSAKATLAGRDPATDIAVLRTEADLIPAGRASAGDLRAGHVVLAVGRDDDGTAAATFGVVSAVDGPWQTWRGGEIDRFIRPDLTVYSGFSGGLLADVAGNAIGMNTWGLSRRMALTVPLSTVERVAAQLLAGGRVKRGYLGIALQTARLPESLRSSLGLAQRTGAIVIDVAHGGPADQAGLTIGDVILALDGSPVEDSDDVQRLLAAVLAGQSAVVRVLRGGAVRELTVMIGERPE
jgi:S1-C subfamily serine protease